MNSLQLSQATPEYMDSREIAEQTGKRHDHVLRDIEKMLLDLDEGDALRFGAVYIGGNGEERKCYHLPKRECLILASGYSVSLRAKIIDRWAELESKPTEAPAIQIFTPEQAALQDFKFKSQIAKDMADLFGYSIGHVKAEALVIGHKIHKETGYSVTPEFLLNDPTAINPDPMLTSFEGTSAGLVASGSNVQNVTDIAKLFPKLTPTDITDLLVEIGYATRLPKAGKKKKGNLTPTQAGVIFANTTTLASGPNKGRLEINGWDLGFVAFKKILFDALEQKQIDVVRRKESNRIKNIRRMI